MAGLYDYTPTIVNTGQAFNQGISLGQNERLNDLQQRLANGDKSVVQAITAINPQLASQYTTQQNAVNEQLARGAQAVAKAPADQQAAIYKAQRDMAIKNGIPGAESLPQTYDANAQAMIKAQIGAGLGAEQQNTQQFTGGQNDLNRAVQYSQLQVQKQLGDPFANAMANLRAGQVGEAEKTAMNAPIIAAQNQAIQGLQNQKTGGINLPFGLNLFGSNTGADQADAYLAAQGIDDKTRNNMSAAGKIATAQSLASQNALKAQQAQTIHSGLSGAVDQAINRSAKLGAGATVQPLFQGNSGSKFGGLWG